MDIFYTQDVKYYIGDLIWAKLGCHPYWPCMISYDPLKGCYWKAIKGNDKSRMYHVQYFGKKAQHGWIYPQLTFYFKGETHYYNTKIGLINQFEHEPLTQSKISEQFGIAQGVLPYWRIAVEEAAIALLWTDRQERYKTFVFKYETVTKKKPTITNGTTLKRTTLKRNRKRKRETKKQPQVTKPSSINEKICKICEGGNGDITCSGGCLQSFHKDCLGIFKAPETFKCLDCERGLDTCLVCKVAEPSLTKCKKCDYHYHDECMKKFKCADFEKKICPLHVCLTCYNENPRNISSKGSFVQCFRCPTVFHATNKCIPVGSVLLTPTLLYCPDHFVGKNRPSPLPVCNVSYCAKCSDGGELICCEACPMAYHRQCIDGVVPAGEYFCEDCSQRKYLYIHMVVWAKTGNFRFWPAQIMDPEDVPDNIKNMQKYNGEFLLQYFGAGVNRYSWTHRGRVIPYIEEHKDLYVRRFFKHCKRNEDFQTSLKEAEKAYDEYIFERQNKMSTSKPDTFKHIRVNHAVPPAQVFVADVKSMDRCQCKPDTPNPCSTGSECMNSVLSIECHPDICPAGKDCQNQRFVKRQYASLKLIKTEKRGWGLQANEFIAQGSFIIEYVGEVITHEEYNRRTIQMQEDNSKNYYFLYLDSKRMIDAGPKGNLARFINHSCDPNCTMEKWNVNGDLRIGIFSKHDIQPGTELTFNYQSEEIKFNQKCFCGSEKCVGVIGRNGGKQTGKKKSN